MATWTPMTAQYIAHYSAVCAAFAQELATRVRLPGPQVQGLGLILVAFGSKPLEAFMPPTALAQARLQCPALASHPLEATIWNSALAPLAVAGLCLASVLWYQGEDNSHTPAAAQAYRCQLRLFLTALRGHFSPAARAGSPREGSAILPVHVVSLASRNLTAGRHVRYYFQVESPRPPPPETHGAPTLQ